MLNPLSREQNRKCSKKHPRLPIPSLGRERSRAMLSPDKISQVKEWIKTLGPRANRHHLIISDSHPKGCFTRLAETAL